MPLSDEHAVRVGQLPLPPTITLQETPHAWHYTFSRFGWRWAAGLVLAGLAVDAAINSRLGPQALALPRGFFSALAWWGLAAFALHAFTCRWALSVRDGGITVRRQSWLWSRADKLPGRSSQALEYKLLYTTGSGGSENRYHAVYAQEGDRAALVQLTPGLKGDAAATALGQSLALAWLHRQNRCSPGAQRDARTGHTGRPTWGGLCCWGLR